MQTPDRTAKKSAKLLQRSRSKEKSVGKRTEVDRVSLYSNIAMSQSSNKVQKKRNSIVPAAYIEEMRRQMRYKEQDAYNKSAIQKAYLN